LKEILQKIYPKSQKQALDDILKIYEKNEFVVSNFLYFAIINIQKLFESNKDINLKFKKTTTQKEYKKAIMK